MATNKKYVLETMFAMFIIGFFVYLIPTPVFAITCVQISSDLSSGQTDSSSGGSIRALQNFLQLNGFFASNPNGHFGPATLTAVKTFQSNNNISSTGFVGPLTRALISQKTCGSIAAQTTSPITTTTQQPAQTPIVAVSNTNITSPTTGQVLAIGSSTVIRWNNPVGSTFDISLEQPGGSGAGFVASSQSSSLNGNQYVWKVGQVYSSQTNSNISVQPGTYRLRLQSSISGANSSDQTSGWFTITASQFGVSSVVPSSAYADNSTSVVLFGAGFTSGSTVYFDSNYSNYRANNSYVSPDGTVLVFTIPTNVPTGSHTLYINNGQSSTPVTLPFTVTSIQ